VIRSFTITRKEKYVDKFYTIHMPKQHTAYRLDGRVLVGSQPTEIDLSRKLKAIGINLLKYKYYNNRGDSRFLITNWEMA